MPDLSSTHEPGLRSTLGVAQHRRRVLVVEDDYLMAQDIWHELDGLGLEVIGPVPSVEGALALLASGATLPDAAILDVNLGGAMVFPVAEVLRDRGVPFVFATGYDPWSLPQAYAGVPCFEKPFDVGRCVWTLFGEAPS